MEKLAEAAENGDQDVLRKIIDGAKLITDLCARIESTAAGLAVVDTDSAPDDLRNRVRAALTKLKMSETRSAKRAGIPQPSLNRFMLGQGKTSKGNISKIEAALGDLADYATTT
jgi:hypothetical protein